MGLIDDLTSFIWDVIYGAPHTCFIDEGMDSCKWCVKGVELESLLNKYRDQRDDNGADPRDTKDSTKTLPSKLL